MKKVIKINKKGSKYIIQFFDLTQIRINSETLKNFSLKEGKIITDSELSHIIEYDDFFEARKSALRYLSIRNHFISELKQKLQRKKIKTEIIDEVINDLYKSRYLNDKESIKEYVREMIRKNYGPIKIRADLIRKGVDLNLIEEELENYGIDEQKNVIMRLLNKKNIFNNDVILKNKQSIFNYLYNRGFSFETIRDSLKDIQRLKALKK